MQAENQGAKLGRTKLIAKLNFAMREASGLGVVFSDVVAERLGVNHTDLECLDIIVMRDRVTAGDLAKATGLTTGAVTGIIDRLEKAGLARRSRDPDDRRKVYVSVLPAAKSRAMVYYGSLEKSVNRLLADYSDSELALFADYFTRTRDVMLREIERLKAKK